MKNCFVFCLFVFPMFIKAQSSDSIKKNIDTIEACNKHKVYEKVEQMPYYIGKGGGEEALARQINKSFKKDTSIHGSIAILCIVNCKGRVCGFKIKKGINEQYDQRMITQLRSFQNWLPGKQNGYPIDCFMILRFKIEDGKINL